MSRKRNGLVPDFLIAGLRRENGTIGDEIGPITNFNLNKNNHVDGPPMV